MRFKAVEPPLDPPVTIRTSSMTTIPLGLVSFDYHMRGELFGYEFSRFFGAQEESRPSTIRVHAVALASIGVTALDSAVAFSFPLCGATQPYWTLGEVMRFVRGQVTEFLHHLGELDYTDLFIHSWDSAQFFFIPCSLESQLIMYMIADTSIAPCYVYVHEDTHSLERAIEVGEFTWFSLRRALMEQLTTF